MNFNEAFAYITNLERVGSEYGLERMQAILNKLGYPELSYKIIHVAGTNGKGSTCAFTANILMSAGYKVGSFFSPSVFTYRERFQINMQLADEDKIAQAFTIVTDCMKKHSIRATAFEVETAVALVLFKNEKVDYVILETGLGGRWDATNAVKQKEISAISKISLDHQAILGNTLEEIAKEKVAISNGTIYTTFQNKKLNYIFEETEGKVIYTNEPKPISTKYLEYQKFEYDGTKYKTQLLGSYQIENASLAILIAKALIDKGAKISEDNIKEGIYNTKWGARFQVIKDNNIYGIDIEKDKVLILDGSHNIDGAKSLVSSIKKTFAEKKVGFVFGVLADKDYKEITKILSEVAEFFITIQSDSPRALDKYELAKECRKYLEEVETSENIKDGIKLGLSKTNEVVLCGSLTLFSDLERI